MKIKLDFITNSSSSSFVVMGATIGHGNIPDEIFQLVADKLDYSLEEVKEDIGEFIVNMVEKTDLDYSYGYEYSGDLMVGIPYTKMNDDETLGQFKEKVRKQIQEALGIDTQPYHIEECWWDG